MFDLDDNDVYAQDILQLLTMVRYDEDPSDLNSNGTKDYLMLMIQDKTIDVNSDGVLGLNDQIVPW